MSDTKQKRVNNDRINLLPQGFKWVYPKKGEILHGFKARHAYNGQVGLSLRQVNDIALGKKTYEQALAISLGGVLKPSDPQFAEMDKKTNYKRYSFTSRAEANLFAANLSSDSMGYPGKRVFFMVGHGQTVDAYTDDNDGMKWLRLLGQKDAGNTKLTQLSQTAEADRYRKNFIHEPDEIDVTVYNTTGRM